MTMAHSIFYPTDPPPPPLPKDGRYLSPQKFLSAPFEEENRSEGLILWQYL